MNRQRTRRFRRRNPYKPVERRVEKLHLPFTCRLMVRSLSRMWGAKKYARLYIGDVKLGDRAGCAAISVYRSKVMLERLELLNVVHTRGGWTRNGAGDLVRAATGYEPHVAVIAAEEEEAEQRRRPDAAAAAPRRPGQVQTFAEYMEEVRAGP